MKFLRNLFSMSSASGEAAAVATDEFQGYKIYAEPTSRGAGQWQTAGRITKQFGEETREHQFIRADTHPSKEGAADFSLQKGRQIIQELGDSIFDA
ncbi:HlyU family transcriptional regulator [Polycladidibacter hongkongensis]|uniref:HlyU family transcriptional regulator n=1 Tax=Polycladidibacter hongkongensis TaxID=1647556 RepID=UPI00083493E0|nr:HlyU family transcriptional regulator [Pseudovibrio hongkongensis]